MFEPLLAALPLEEINRLWYALPLVVTISLVYGATRHERPRPIIEHAIRFGLWILTFMAVIFVVLWLLTLGL